MTERSTPGEDPLEVARHFELTSAQVEEVLESSPAWLTAEEQEALAEMLRAMRQAEEGPAWELRTGLDGDTYARLLLCASRLVGSSEEALELVHGFADAWSKRSEEEAPPLSARSGEDLMRQLRGFARRSRRRANQPALETFDEGHGSIFSSTPSPEVAAYRAEVVGAFSRAASDLPERWSVGRPRRVHGPLEEWEAEAVVECLRLGMARHEAAQHLVALAAQRRPRATPPRTAAQRAAGVNKLRHRYSRLYRLLVRLVLEELT